MNESQPDQVHAFFVYGTLKKSQLRGGLWPRRPKSISQAIIQAILYDLGSYPSVWPGAGWVLGEIWEFAHEDVPATTDALDQVEGFHALGQDNEYNREVVDCEMLGADGKLSSKKAFAYFVAHEHRILQARRIDPFLEFAGRPVAAWPAPFSRVPRSFAEE